MVSGKLTFLLVIFYEIKLKTCYLFLLLNIIREQSELKDTYLASMKTIIKGNKLVHLIGIKSLFVDGSYYED